MKFTPLRITIIYFILSIAWITMTDQLVGWMTSDVELITQFQTVKGYLFITITSLIMYWMVRNFGSTIKREQELQGKILSTIPIMITVYHPSLSEISVNREFEKITGWLNSDFLSDDIIHKTHPDRDERKEVMEFMKNPDGQWKDFEVTAKDGRKIQTTWTNLRLSDDTYLGIGLDITERKLIEEQYRLLFDQNPIPMVIYDPDTFKLSAVNNATLEKYGYTEQEMLNSTILDIRPESGIEEVKRIVQKHRKSQQPTFNETTHVTKEGRKLRVEIYSASIFYKGKDQRLVIAHDITDQRKAEEWAISAIVEGEERERQRIAKELHDGLGQYLSASNMNLKSVYEDLRDIPEKLSSTFKIGLDFLNHAISETRNISQNLLPKAIQDYGLELAAESLINHLRKNNEIEFYFYKKLDDVSFSDNIQINLYRILQESLNNAIRHGKPTRIDVQLVYSDGEILMTIEDNGKGFNKNNIKGEGIGIRSMKTRVGAMSANLDIVSNEGRGTIVSVVVPIN